MITLRTGDLIFFSRLPLSVAIRAQGWRGFFGWLSNSLIAAAQRVAQRSKANHYNLIHVGVVVRTTNGARLAEFTARQRGPGLTLLAERCRDYPGVIRVKPLRDSARGKLDLAEFGQAVGDAADCTYNVPGLLAAVTKFWWKGWPRSGQFFCSEFVAYALQRAGALAREIIGCSPDGQADVPVALMPQQYSPCELADISALFDNSESRIISKGGIISPDLDL